MTTVVIVENPVWFQKETSIDSGTYLIIKRFVFNQHTKCYLQSDNNTKIQASDALEGALNGWYECHFYQLELVAKKERIIKFEKDNSTLQAAVGVAAFLAIGVCFLGK